MTDQGGTRGHEAEGPIVEPADLVPDPLVEKLVPDPSQPPPPAVALTQAPFPAARGAVCLCLLLDEV
jgi:hypothetical protein